MVYTAVRECGLDPHPDIATLFSWHNGYRRPEPGSGHFHFGGINDTRIYMWAELHSLETAVEEYTQIWAPDTEGDTSWFPLFGYNDGSIVICCDASSPHFGKVSQRDWVEDFDPHARVPDLLTVIRWWTHWLADGSVHHSDDTGWINDLTEDDLTPLQRDSHMAFTYT